MPYSVGDGSNIRITPVEMPDIPDTTKQVSSLMQAVQRASGGGRGGGGGSSKMAAIYDAATNTWRYIPFVNNKEIMSHNLEQLRKRDAMVAVAGDADIRKKLEGFGGMSVQKQASTLSDIRTNDLPRLAAKTGLDHKDLMEAAIGEQSRQHAQFSQDVKNQGAFGTLWDSFRIGFRGFLDGVQDMFSNSEQQLVRARSREQHRAQITAENPVLENRRRRMAEGAGILDRFGEGMLNEAAASGGEFLGISGGPLALAGGGAGIGRAIGAKLVGTAGTVGVGANAVRTAQAARTINRAGLIGAATGGAIGGAPAQLGAVTDVIATDPNLTDQQKLEALDSARVPSLLFGAATGAVVIPFAGPIGQRISSARQARRAAKGLGNSLEAQAVRARANAIRVAPAQEGPRILNPRTVPLDDTAAQQFIREGASSTWPNRAAARNYRNTIPNTFERHAKAIDEARLADIRAYNNRGYLRRYAEAIPDTAIEAGIFGGLSQMGTNVIAGETTGSAYDPLANVGEAALMGAFASPFLAPLNLRQPRHLPDTPATTLPAATRQDRGGAAGTQPTGSTPPPSGSMPPANRPIIFARRIPDEDIGGGNYAWWRSQPLSPAAAALAAGAGGSTGSPAGNFGSSPSGFGSAGSVRTQGGGLGAAPVASFGVVPAAGSRAMALGPAPIVMPSAGTARTSPIRMPAAQAQAAPIAMPAAARQNQQAAPQGRQQAQTQQTQPPVQQNQQAQPLVQQNQQQPVQQTAPQGRQQTQQQPVQQTAPQGRQQTQQQPVQQVVEQAVAAVEQQQMQANGSGQPRVLTDTQQTAPATQEAPAVRMQELNDYVRPEEVQRIMSLLGPAEVARLQNMSPEERSAERARIDEVVTALADQSLERVELSAADGEAAALAEARAAAQETVLDAVDEATGQKTEASQLVRQNESPVVREANEAAAAEALTEYALASKTDGIDLSPEVAGHHKSLWKNVVANLGKSFRKATTPEAIAKIEDSGARYVDRKVAAEDRAELASFLRHILGGNNLGKFYSNNAQRVMTGALRRLDELLGGNNANAVAAAASPATASAAADTSAAGGTVRPSAGVGRTQPAGTDRSAGENLPADNRGQADAAGTSPAAAAELSGSSPVDGSSAQERRNAGSTPPAAREIAQTEGNTPAETGNTTQQPVGESSPAAAAGRDAAGSSGQRGDESPAGPKPGNNRDGTDAGRSEQPDNGIGAGSRRVEADTTPQPVEQPVPRTEQPSQLLTSKDNAIHGLEDMLFRPLEELRPSLTLKNEIRVGRGDRPILDNDLIRHPNDPNRFRIPNDDELSNIPKADTPPPDSAEEQPVLTAPEEIVAKKAVIDVTARKPEQQAKDEDVTAMVAEQLLPIRSSTQTQPAFVDQLLPGNVIPYDWYRARLGVFLGAQSPDVGITVNGVRYLFETYNQFFRRTHNYDHATSLRALAQDRDSTTQAQAHAIEQLLTDPARTDTAEQLLASDLVINGRATPMPFVLGDVNARRPDPLMDVTFVRLNQLMDSNAFGELAPNIQERVQRATTLLGDDIRARVARLAEDTQRTGVKNASVEIRKVFLEDKKDTSSAVALQSVIDIFNARYAESFGEEGLAAATAQHVERKNNVFYNKKLDIVIGRGDYSVQNEMAILDVLNDFRERIPEDIVQGNNGRIGLYSLAVADVYNSRGQLKPAARRAIESAALGILLRRMLVGPRAVSPAEMELMSHIVLHGAPGWYAAVMNPAAWKDNFTPLGAFIPPKNSGQVYELAVSLGMARSDIERLMRAYNGFSPEMFVFNPDKYAYFLPVEGEDIRSHMTGADRYLPLQRALLSDQNQLYTGSGPTGDRGFFSGMDAGLEGQWLVLDMSSGLANAGKRFGHGTAENNDLVYNYRQAVDAPRVRRAIGENRPAQRVYSSRNYEWRAEDSSTHQAPIRSTYRVNGQQRTVTAKVFLDRHEGTTYPFADKYEEYLVQLSVEEHMDIIRQKSLGPFERPSRDNVDNINGSSNETSIQPVMSNKERVLLNRLLEQLDRVTDTLMDTAATVLNDKKQEELFNRRADILLRVASLGDKLNLDKRKDRKFFADAWTRIYKSVYRTEGPFGGRDFISLVLTHKQSGHNRDFLRQYDSWADEFLREVKRLRTKVHPAGSQRRRDAYAQLADAIKRAKQDNIGMRQLFVHHIASIPILETRAFHDEPAVPGSAAAVTAKSRNYAEFKKELLHFIERQQDIVRNMLPGTSREMGNIYMHLKALYLAEPNWYNAMARDIYKDRNLYSLYEEAHENAMADIALLVREAIDTQHLLPAKVRHSPTWKMTPAEIDRLDLMDDWYITWPVLDKDLLGELIQQSAAAGDPPLSLDALYGLESNRKETYPESPYSIKKYSEIRIRDFNWVSSKPDGPSTSGRTENDRVYDADLVAQSFISRTMSDKYTVLTNPLSYKCL